MGNYFRCNRCFGPWKEGQEVCEYCGLDLKEEMKLRKPEGFTEKEDSYRGKRGKRKLVAEEFSDEDVDAMFAALEQRLAKQSNMKFTRDYNSQLKQPKHGIEPDFDEMTLDEVIAAMRQRGR